jgi:hypothetical protein
LLGQGIELLLQPNAVFDEGGQGRGGCVGCHTSNTSVGVHQITTSLSGF